MIWIDVCEKGVGFVFCCNVCLIVKCVMEIECVGDFEVEKVIIEIECSGYVMEI